MSYRTWHDYGYGICTDNIPQDDVAKLEALLSKAPKFFEELKGDLKESGIERPTVQDYINSNVAICDGLAGILANVIQEAEDIRLTPCTNYDGVGYLLYVPLYPWAERTEGESKIKTKENVEDLLNKYISILTDKQIDIDYQSVENGG